MDTSYLTTQVTTIIGQLHGLFDEIGVPSHDRESRESEVKTASITISPRLLTCQSSSLRYLRHCTISFGLLLRTNPGCCKLCATGINDWHREKNDLTEEAYRIIKTIRQMEASLEDHKPNDDYPLEDEQLIVFTPLTRCIKGLKEQQNQVAKVHRERFEQVKSGLTMLCRTLS